MSEAGGGELFIVDNSVSGWTGLEYLSQWTDVARSFDIATGFFEIGALLALDGEREVTAATARDLADVLGTTSQVWLNLQAAWDRHSSRHDGRLER